MYATMTADNAQINDRQAAAIAKRARRAARQTNQHLTPVVTVVESDRVPAPAAILPNVKLCATHGANICRLRQAYSRFPLKQALKLLQIVSEDDTIEGLIAEGLYYVEKTEAKLRAKAELERIEACKANFPDHVRRLAGVFFPSRPQAQSMFVRRALEIGYGPNNAIETARSEAWAWLHPAPKGKARIQA